MKSKNIGILLTGGSGNRFSPTVLKQMYVYNSLPLFMHSLQILVNVLDIVIIVVNSICYKDVLSIVGENSKVYITINDYGDRLESIEHGLCFIQNNITTFISNLIIHDSARPFIKEEHINTLLSKMNSNVYYSQYYFKLTNGLLKFNNGKYEEVNRDDFIEICTPICVNYKLYEFLFFNYIKKERRIFWEIIPLLDIFKIKYELVEGQYKYIRKITKITDLEDIF